jgi:hypothetical protein
MLPACGLRGDMTSTVPYSPRPRYSRYRTDAKQTANLQFSGGRHPSEGYVGALMITCPNTGEPISAAALASVTERPIALPLDLAS